jgi:hypothetical protein
MPDLSYLAAFNGECWASLTPDSRRHNTAANPIWQAWWKTDSRLREKA